MAKRRTTNKENYEKRKKKNKAKKWLGIICAFLAGLILCAGVTQFTAEKDLNPDNLLVKKDTYITNLLKETDKGLKIDWKDDGAFVLSGKHADDNEANNAMYMYEFATLELEPGKYTINSGNDKASSETYGMFVKYDGQIKHNVYGDAVTFDIDGEETKTVIIGFAVKNHYRILYAKFEPVLVKGDKAGSFYVEK